MTEKQIERIRIKIARVKSALAAYKKRWGGYYDDSGGIRYMAPGLYLKIRDFKGAMNYFRWFITKHIANIFEEGELVEESNVHFLHIANSDKPVKHYNLDVIISVGYCVNSVQGTQFRICTQRLKEYIVKSFALNDERFKSGNSMNYFNEL